MQRRKKTKVDQVQSRTSTDPKENLLNKIDDLTNKLNSAQDTIDSLNTYHENKQAELKKQIKTLHAQKGGFVKHNNAYRKLIGELNINIKSKDIQVKSLKRKCEGLELTLDESYKYSRTNIDARNKLSIELQLIKTTWWYKLFTWSW